MESYRSEDNSCREERIEEIVGNDHIINSDELQTLIVALGQRNGADIEPFLDSEDDFKAFIELLNDLGLNCFILRDPEETNVESFAALFGEEDLETSGFKEMIERELKARVYITKDASYSTTFFERMEGNESYGARYHRKMGEFYGYPQEDIDAFVYFQAPVWRKLITRIIDGEKTAISTTEAFEKYGGDCSEEEKRIFNSFISHMLADTGESFDKNMDRARSIEEAFNRAGIDTEEYLNSIDM